MMMALPLIFLVAFLQDTSPPTAGAPPEERAAAIRGRITDKERGLPLTRAVVRLHKLDQSKPLYARTDDNGRYEFVGLAPGEYTGFVEPGEHRATHLTQPLADPATPRRRGIVLSPGEVREDVNIALPRALAITVRVVDEWGGPLSGLEINVMAAGTGRQVYGSFHPRQTDDRGRLRVYGLSPGSYSVCAEIRRIGGSAQRTAAAQERFLSTCYPSTSNESEAEPVTLQRADVDLEIRMRRGRTFSISGIVVDASGTPAPQAMALLNQYESRRSSGTTFNIGPDARFTITNVVPGDYAITAEIGGPHRPEHRREQENAFYPVRVDSSDVEGLVITTTKTIDVHGRVTLEDTTVPLPKPPGSAARLMVLARLANDWLSGTGSQRPGTMDQDRRFVLDNMFGSRVLDFANVPRGWYVKSVRYQGKEIIDTPTEFVSDGGHPALEVILSTRGSVVTGRVLDDRGDPVSRGRVLMFRAGDDLRKLEPFSSVAVSSSGAFRTGPVRAGEYLVVALPPGVASPDSRDHARLRDLMESANSVTLGAEEERTLDVNVIRP